MKRPSGPRSGCEMTTDSLAAALEREHHGIDAGIEEFLTARKQGHHQVEPLRLASAALRRHIFLEEEFVFPSLREAGLVAPIFVMLREHGEIWDTLDAIDAQLGREADAWTTSAICHLLLDQLKRHNDKEEPIVYSQIAVALSEPAESKLRAFLDAGRMPPAWRCRQAGA
jgi:regulator of cell morphogenesis and NO signaling